MRLGCFDVDGTMLPHWFDPLPKEVVDAVHEFGEKGNAVCIASGRPFGSGRKFLDAIGAERAYVVAVNGSIVFDGSGKVLWKASLGEKDFLHFQNELKKFLGASVYCYLETEKAPDCLAAYRPCGWADTENACNVFADYVDLSKNPNILHGAKLPKIMLAAEPDVSNFVYEHLDPQDFLDYHVFRSDPHFIEVAPKGVSKSTGVEKLREILGIKKEDVYTFGDADNDIEMLRDFNGVAMENATPGAKAAAKYHTKSCEEHGVAYALSDILHLI